jgi:hypothetical protein
MTAQFWTWIFAVIVILGWGYNGYYAKYKWWYGSWLAFALWVFFVSYIIAGNPFHALVK